MNYTVEQWLSCREEANRLKMEMKKHNLLRASLVVPEEIEDAISKSRELQD